MRRLVQVIGTVLLLGGLWVTLFAIAWSNDALPELLAQGTERRSGEAEGTNNGDEPLVEQTRRPQDPFQETQSPMPQTQR